MSLTIGKLASAAGVNAQTIRYAVSRRVEAKIAATEQKIHELQSLLKALNRVRASCAARKRTEDCPVLEALVKDA